jgi:hypothetical protein
MTEGEMNDFLISIGGLENGWKSYKSPIEHCGYFEVDNGWFSLIKELIEDLIKLGWDKQVTQVKEKFGGLRFYINEGTDEIFKRISEAENKSYEICEVTGESGTLRTDIGWYRTLCDEEYEKIKNKKENGI